MHEIKSKQLFFIDSRTTPNTVASRAAENKNLFNSSRDVFLDNERSIFAIHEQFRKLIDVAKRKGTGIAIGHLYGETLTYLEMAIPQLQQEGIEVIPVSNLIVIQHPTTCCLPNGWLLSLVLGQSKSVGLIISPALSDQPGPRTTEPKGPKWRNLCQLKSETLRLRSG